MRFVASSKPLSTIFCVTFKIWIWELFESKYLNSNIFHGIFVYASTFFHDTFVTFDWFDVNKHCKLSSASPSKFSNSKYQALRGPSCVCHASHSCHFTAHEPNWPFFYNTGDGNGITVVTSVRLVVDLRVLPCLAGIQVHPWTCHRQRSHLLFQVFPLTDLVAADVPPEGEFGRWEHGDTDWLSLP